MCRYIGADSLQFLSIDGLYRAVGGEKRNPAGRSSPTTISPATIPTRPRHAGDGQALYRQGKALRRLRYAVICGPPAVFPPCSFGPETG
jgi:hypothetical protein